MKIAEWTNDSLTLFPDVTLEKLLALGLGILIGFLIVYGILLVFRAMKRVMKKPNEEISKYQDFKNYFNKEKIKEILTND